MEDHYKILGIKRTASQEEVKKAYFVMAKKYHPDSGDETEIQRFHEVTRAYKVLSDPDSKKIYDLSLGIKQEDVKKAGTASKSGPASVGKRESYRDDELKEFHQNRYRKAVFRVLLFTLFIGIIGGTVGIVLDSRFLWNFLAGICIGFSFSINQNFKIESFFRSDKAHKLFRIFTWLLFLGGLGYFVRLIVKGLV